ncbi:MAG: hypothetical protein DMG47_05320 [Acidobacteria bacterium]|nr:MAG: hypothetical protein DMG47_05320 [Acidobacteriota bacterium]
MKECVSREARWKFDAAIAASEQKTKIVLDVANKKRNPQHVLRGGLCLQFTPHRRRVFGFAAAAFLQPQPYSFLSALMP